MRTNTRKPAVQNRTSAKSVVSLMLAALLIVQSVIAQQPETASNMKQTISRLSPRAHVELQLADGSTVRGRITSRGDHDFTIKRDGDGTQNIAYDQVRSVSQLKGGHSSVKWALIGVGAGIAVAVIIVAIILKTRGPFG